ncbi:MAG: hypothetical protein CSA33_07240 [Desulfobulbus propionicus]|nr:MAG: hypothetical protein CSA33_07240 [Desulfobulbus propionicus]
MVGSQKTACLLAMKESNVFGFDPSFFHLHFVLFEKKTKTDDCDVREQAHISSSCAPELISNLGQHSAHI